MADEFGDTPSASGIPDPHDAFRSAACDNGPGRSKCIHAALVTTRLLFADVDLQNVARAGEVPQAHLLIQTARCDPVDCRSGRREALDIVAMEPNGLRR